MFERRRCLTAFIIILIGCTGVYLNTMSDHNSPELPFLSDSDAINYVESSKLMVLISNKEENIFRKIQDTYGLNATCVSDEDVSKRIADVQAACTRDQHVVAISVGNFESSDPPDMQPYTQIARDQNYIVSVVNGPENLLPDYIGWHLNEADSCMLGLCAHALLEDLLKTVPEFCSDFRNYSQGETIPEMLKFYQLADSNHNGMLHCTAKYFGSSPDESSKEYFREVKGNITMNFETTVIGIVFTPRTFGARLKLSQEQLKLWGGDDDGKAKMKTVLKNEIARSNEDDRVSSLNSAMAHHSIQCDSNNLATTDSKLPMKKKSARYFPNSQASLVYLTTKSEEDPDFHPVSGRGSRAHMTLGIAPGESAVTTGYDLLEVVKLEEEEKDWPTYPTTRGWLRDYGENRWVLYMKNKITVETLFAGVYSVS
ncbi:2',3'-cyclic-nucleotide 3'-phosphodiesterase-like isoform X2 [Thrips palmi]|uniref:2',3'-cyclic-nucleotide 3'-phosphodiesterase-like isoform X2 n=1 Tax=Thrips palmi TaxID=161013 RepID=A0A6P8ZZZ4_THRPL|nr:2',3'-cyclic-nucleotide 3'-phosphodiesterase-like isoform X2 [Thrips palmi]